MTPEEIQSTAQNLKKAFEAGAITAEQFNEGMTDVTKGVKNYTANLSAALNQLGTAAKSLGEGMLKGEQGMSQYNNAVVSGGDVVANAAMQFGPLGIAVGALIKIVTFGISQVNDMADGLYKANQDLSKVGAAGAEGNDGAERVVGDKANVEFAAALGARHFLDGDAVDACSGLQFRYRLDHGVVDVAHAYSIGNVENHAVNVAFVADVGRIDLQCHRVAQLGRDHHGLVGAARQDGLWPLPS
jgi:hypothetical protein